MNVFVMLGLAFVLGGTGTSAHLRRLQVTRALPVSSFHDTLVGSDYVAELSVVYGDIEIVGERAIVERLAKDRRRTGRLHAWIKSTVWRKIESTPEEERIGERAYALTNSQSLCAIYPEVALQIVPQQFIMCEAHLRVRSRAGEGEDEKIAILPTIKLP